MPATDAQKAPRTIDVDVEGMTCGSCAARVQRVLGKHRGVVDAEVNYATGRARLQLDSDDVDLQDLRAAVDRIGYGLTPASELQQETAAAEDPEAAAQRLWLRRVAIAWPLALVVAWLAMLSPFGEESWARWTEFALTTPVQLYVGWPFIREAGRRARRFTANMDTLIAIGTLAAYLFSTVQLFTGGDLYFETAALIIAFLVLGRYFEARAKSRAGKAIAALLELGAAEEVAAAGHDRDLDPAADHLGHVVGDGRDDVGVDADLAAAEHLARELEQHALVLGHPASFREVWGVGRVRTCEKAGPLDLWLRFKRTGLLRRPGEPSGSPA